jgi:N-methylhydantoinase A
LTHTSITDSVKKFHIKHRQVYGYSDQQEPIEIINAKLRVIGHLQKPRLRHRKKNRSDPLPDQRKAYYETPDEWINTEVHQRAKLNGLREGPAIIEQYDATTIVHPNWSYTPDHYGNLILRRTTT